VVYNLVPYEEEVKEGTDVVLPGGMKEGGVDSGKHWRRFFFVFFVFFDFFEKFCTNIKIS